MFAIVEIKGKQYKIQEGEEIEVDRLQASPGEEYTVDKVILIGDGQESKIGFPYLEKAKVITEILTHLRGQKITTIKYKRRKNYRRKLGHRQELTRLRIREIITS
jgi:large subunit ribosomal protein L21